MVSLVFFDILQLPHTVISNSEKLTHPNVHCTVHMGRFKGRFVYYRWADIPTVQLENHLGKLDEILRLVQ